ncbi:MAG: VOC family protein [Alphaproteobacteria bacterium]|nr:VOC family protein [Alphaproteobacteria bacterium]MCL2889754.1 VOC family protein [Alphaproteobacteria bacterium]
MLKVTPILIYDGKCSEALDLYTKAFDAKVIIKMLYREANPKDFVPSPDQLDYIYHTQIKIGEQIIIMGDDSDGVLDGTPPSKSRRMALIIDMGSDDALKTAYDVLSRDAIFKSPIKSTTYFSSSASLTDKFGVHWDLMAGFVGNEKL